MSNKPQVNLKFIKGYGNNFKKLRESKGLTQKQLAELIFISDKSISLIEKEQREPTIEQINIYSEYFNVSLDYLTGRTTISNPTIQAISEQIGLSEQVIDTLMKLKEENKATWHEDIINSILRNKHFYSIVIALTDLATTDNPNQPIDGLSYTIKKKELLETILGKQFSMMIDAIAEEYESRKEEVYTTIFYNAALNLYRKGRLNDKQYQEVLNEYEKGNFEFVPDGFDPHGGADNG